MTVHGRHRNVVGGGAVDGVTDGAPVVAEVPAPNAAPRAVAAEQRRVNRDPVSFVYEVDTGSHGDHFAGELVAGMIGNGVGGNYVPLMLDDTATAQSLRTQAEVAEPLSCYDRINLAIVPIGSWDPPQSQLYDSITPQERRELLDAGVRADTSTVLLSRNGEILTPPLSQRMIGITGEQLRRISEVVAVAGGVDKAEAVDVVLRAGLVTTLITNASVAQQLLKQNSAAAPTSQSSSASIQLSSEAARSDGA